MSQPNVYVPSGWADYRRLAEKRLPRFLFDYIDGGASEEQTLRANQADFAKLELRQQVLRDVSNRSTQCTLLGQTASMPVALAPVGLAGLYAKRGEVQAAKAAQTLGIPFTLSTVGICTASEVNQTLDATTPPTWFQLYMLRDRQAVLAVLEKVRQAGCDTLLFTVDLAVAGFRQRDFRNGMFADGLLGKRAKAAQLITRPRWLWHVGINGKPHQFGNLSDQVADPNDVKAFKAWLDAQFDASVTWDDIAWLRQQWKGKLVLKGIMEPDDALKACDVGADGIVVSNHGGRQLDGVPSTIHQLSPIVKALNGRLPILIDGGVRNGVDVLRAVALGAQGVLVGRPWAWALGAAGQQGIEQLLSDWQQELSIAMALCGVTRIEDINESVIARNNL